MTESAYPSPLPLSKPTRVWLEAVRTTPAVLSLAINVVVLIVVLSR